MKNLVRRYATLALVGAIFLSSTSTVQAATSAKSISMDINGDYVADTIKTIPKSSKGSYTGLNIKVNDQTVKTVNIGYDEYACQAFSLANGNKYLYLMFRDDGNSNFRSALYRYYPDSNKFKREVAVSDTFKKLCKVDIEDNTKDKAFYIKLDSISGNKVYFDVKYFDQLTGITTVKATYEIKGDIDSRRQAKEEAIRAEKEAKRLAKEEAERKAKEEAEALAKAQAEAGIVDDSNQIITGQDIKKKKKTSTTTSTSTKKKDNTDPTNLVLLNHRFEVVGYNRGKKAEKSDSNPKGLNTFKVTKAFTVTSQPRKVAKITTSTISKGSTVVIDKIFMGNKIKYEVKDKGWFSQTDGYGGYLSVK